MKYYGVGINSATQNRNAKCICQNKKSWIPSVTLFTSAGNYLRGIELWRKWIEIAFFKANASKNTS